MRGTFALQPLLPKSEPIAGYRCLACGARRAVAEATRVRADLDDLRAHSERAAAGPGFGHRAGARTRQGHDPC